MPIKVKSPKSGVRTNTLVKPMYVPAKGVNSSRKRRSGNTKASPERIEKSRERVRFLKRMRSALLPLAKRIVEEGRKKGQLTPREGIRIIDCVKYLHIEQRPDGTLKVAGLRRCDKWLICPVCSLRHRRKRTRQLSDDTVSILEAAPDADVWEVLITPGPGVDLRSQMSLLKAGISTLAKHRRDAIGNSGRVTNSTTAFDRMIAGIMIGEVTTVPKGGRKHALEMLAKGVRVGSLWFPHAHGFMVTAPGFDRERFAAEALRVLPSGFNIKVEPLIAESRRGAKSNSSHRAMTPAQQRARRVRTKKRLNERADYFTKSDLARHAKQCLDAYETKSKPDYDQLGIARGLRTNAHAKPFANRDSGKRMKMPRQFFRMGAAQGLPKSLDRVSREYANRRALRLRQRRETSRLFKGIRRRRESGRQP